MEKRREVAAGPFSVELCLTVINGKGKQRGWKYGAEVGGIISRTEGHQQGRWRSVR
jgi:hypothetical protein